MKGSVLSRQYSRKIIGVLLGEKNRHTLTLNMVRDTVGTAGLKVSNTVLVFVTSFLLARLLGAKEYGVYTYAISWASLLSVPAVMGLDTLLVREVAKYTILEDESSLRGILCWSNRVVLIVSSVLALLFGMATWFFQKTFDPEARLALWIAAALLPVFASIRLRQASVRGLGHVVEAQSPLMFVLPVSFLALVSALHFATGLSASLAVSVQVLAAGFALLVATRLLAEHLPPSVATETVPSYHTAEWVKSAFPLLLVGTAGMINQQVSTVMVGTMLGSEAVGIFDVAVKGSALVSFVLMAVNMPLAPAVADLYARAEKGHLQRLVTRSTRVALLASVPIALGLIVFGRWALLVFGDEFTRGAYALAVLSVGQLVNVGMGSVTVLLNMSGHERDSAKGVGIAALTNVGLNAVLIPVWGIEGAAVASATSMVVWNVLLAVWLYQRTEIISFACGPRRKG